VDWPQLLNEIEQRLNPIHNEVFTKYRLGYYWSTYQSEWASDVVFREAATLRRLQPRLPRHGMTALGCTDVMRDCRLRATPEQCWGPASNSLEFTAGCRRWRWRS